jgi:hypothetical protein
MSRGSHYVHRRHSERSEESKGEAENTKTAWILPFAQDDGKEEITEFGFIAP